MKLTIHNYFDQIGQHLELIEADSDYKASYNFIQKVTKNGKEPENLDRSPEIREAFDLFLENLNKTLPQTKSGKKSATAKKSAPKTSKPAAGKTKRKPAAKKLTTIQEETSEQVEHIPSDIALVKRYVQLHDKQKTYEQVLSVWRAFNKAIVERKVTKDSVYRSEIEAMNNSLGVALEAARNVGSLHLMIPAARLKKYQAIAVSVEKAAATGILLEFINISGKPEMRERATKLLKRMERAEQAGKLKDSRYTKELKKVKAALEAYINREKDIIEVEDQTLHGISGIAVLGCACTDGLEGFTRSQNAVVYKLVQEKVKNLGDDELNRAFSDTVAPGLCKTIAHKLMQSRQLTMTLLRNPAKVSGGLALGGTGKYRDFDFNMELMDMRLRNAGKEQHDHSGKPKSKTTRLGAVDNGVSFSSPEEVKIMSARELVSQQFKTMGLQGKYRKLIGDPEPGFSAMIFGKPKQGKSTLAIDFAKELTRHGKVLYCAFEEGHGYTLQDKVKRNNAAVPGLDFANRLPADLSQYAYVFVDSVSDAGLDEMAFKQLIKSNKPGTSIIGVFHATKDGKFRGGQTYAHDVDVLIRVEDGIAYAQGRFAPPNQISIASIQSPSPGYAQAA